MSDTNSMVEVQVNEHPVVITFVGSDINTKSVGEIIQHVKDVEAGVK
jgi:hypothetical protein